MNYKNIVLATSNKGKIDEFSAILQPLGFKIRLQKEFKVKDAEENGLSFIENALIKARNAAKFANMAALADDSGICVDALDGMPGIYSARFSGEHGNDIANNEKLLELLLPYKKICQRKAHYVCALAYVQNHKDPDPIIAIASWHGYIAFSPKGSHGFGYDPIFMLENRALSAAQIPPQLKNLMSHRALALFELKEKLRLRYEQ